MSNHRSRGDFLPCYVYIDGDNIQIALEQAGVPRYFDPTKLAARVGDEQVAGMRLAAVRVFYYDAPNDKAPDDIQQRHQRYLERVKQLPDTHVLSGVIRGKRQKGVDVQLAVDALEAALTGKVGAIAIVSGDGDFAPLAEAIRRAGPHVLVLSFKNALSHDLRMAADRLILLPEQPRDWVLDM